MDFLLSSLVLIPLAGSLIAAALPRKWPALIRGTGLFFAVAVALLSILLYANFDAQAPTMQFVERYAWMPSMGLYFHLGVDGISLFLILLTTGLTPLVLLAGWPAAKERIKEYTCAVLALSAVLVGTFAALDLLLFYVFCEGVLLPAFFLVGMWGRRRRIYAALQMALYSSAAGLPFLVAVIYLGDYHRQVDGQFHFGLAELQQLTLPPDVQLWGLLAFFAYFALRLALFPLHTWFPAVQAAAPLPITVVLAGVALKVGAYGLLRFCAPLFPEAFYIYSAHLAALAVFGAVYGALLAMVQDDLQKMVAHATASQMGLVALGIATLNLQGVQGSVMLLVAHGISSAALLLMAGVFYRRFQTQELAQCGGLSKSMPVFAALFLIASLAFVGLPGSGGFVGGLAILAGSFARFGPHALAAMLAAALIALRFAVLFQRAMWGEEKGMGIDMRWREWAPILSLLLISLWLGLFPAALLQRTEGAVEQLLVRAGTTVEVEGN